MGLLHWLFLAVLLLFGHVSSKPMPHEVQNNHDDNNKDQTLQGGTHPSIHEVDSETTESEGTEGDPSLNKEVLLTEPDQDVEEEPLYDEDAEMTADKRGGGGSLHRNHSRRNHTVTQKQKRNDKSSEEDHLELLSADHVSHKRSAEPDGHKLEKRSTGQGIEEEDSDGSFDGLEYVGEFDDKEKDREKRNHQHHEPEETVEMEEVPPYMSDMSQHVQSVVPLRVKRVNKAGSSHRNLRINKNKGNSKAGQTEEQPPPVMIDPM